MSGTIADLVPPGPAPVAPLLPLPGLERLARQLEELVEELARMRRVHEDAFPLVTDDHFAGDAGDEVRWRLAGQLRRSRALVDDLRADLDHVLALIARARRLEDLHAAALVAWRRSVADYQQAMLAGGHGPRPMPTPVVAGWARQRIVS